jgi:hypothetical protein
MCLNDEHVLRQGTGLVHSMVVHPPSCLQANCLGLYNCLGG